MLEKIKCTSKVETRNGIINFWKQKRYNILKSMGTEYEEE